MLTYRSIPFGIFTALTIPSIPCYLLIFIQCFRKRILRKYIRSHIILLVLLCSFLQVISEVPTILSYLYNGIAPIQSDFFCKFWACQDYSFNVMLLMLTAYTSIERYLLVFHRGFFNQHLLIVHYIPMILLCIYPLILYIYLIFFYPCENAFDYTMVTCGGPCYYYQAAISIFDQFFNLVLPVSISTLASMTLLIRVIRQKHRMQQQHMWRKNRRLVLQLLYIVILHNIVWLPMVVCSTIMFFSPIARDILLNLTINILPNGIYVVILLCPFISLMSLPRLLSQFYTRNGRVIRNHNSVRPLAPLPAIYMNTTSRGTLSPPQHAHQLVVTKETYSQYPSINSR